jgi:hypothetical protein
VRGSAPETWAHLVEHDPERRRHELLLRDDHVAVWLICWMDDHDTGFHDHDLSAGAVGVVTGAVREDRLVLGGDTVSRILRPARPSRSPPPTSTGSCTRATRRP